MAPKELSRYQLSSKLAYQAHVPAFLQKLQNRIAGGAPDPEDEFSDGDGGGGGGGGGGEDDGEFEYVGNGRPPIPKRPRSRPPIPQHPASQPGSADEKEGDDDDLDDEKPQIVVLKEGKHLSEREVANIRRKEKGLPPLPEAQQEEALPSSSKQSALEKAKQKDESKGKSLSFSSGKSTTSISKTNKKRKAIGQPDSESDGEFRNRVLNSDNHREKGKEKEKGKSKKPKKQSKKLLSFGDEA